MIQARKWIWIAAVLTVAAVALPSCTSSEPFVMDDCVRRDLGGRSVAR